MMEFPMTFLLMVLILILGSYLLVLLYLLLRFLWMLGSDSGMVCNLRFVVL